MIYVYGGLVVLGLVMFADSILVLVDTLELQHYWSTVGLCLLSLLLIHINQYNKGYRIKSPFLFFLAVVFTTFGYPLAIISTHTAAEFIQYEFGSESVLLAVICTFTALGFVGVRNDNSTGWGNDNRSDLSRKIDER